MVIFTKPTTNDLSVANKMILDHATSQHVRHDQVEAMTMGDRIVVMKDGWIQQVDTPLNIYNHPANQFVAGFIGSPPMNFFAGRVVRQNNQIIFDEGHFRIPLTGRAAEVLSAYDGQSVTMGIRPENIHERGNRPDADPAHTVTATVEVVEMMGSEVYLYASTGFSSFTARVQASCRKQIGDTVEVVLDLAHAHFFAGPEGKALL